MRRYGDAGMRWGTLERVPQTPQNFSKTGLRSLGIGTDARFRDFSCSLPLPCRPDTRGRACPAGHLLRRFSQCRFRLSPGDARGEAPCIRKLKIPPSPEGKSALRARVGGMGAEKQAKGKVSQQGGELFQESPGASLSPPGATAVLPQKRRRRSASDRGSPTAHRSAQCGGKSWR